jgi:hypothetical protein
MTLEARAAYLSIEAVERLSAALARLVAATETTL